VESERRDHLVFRNRVYAGVKAFPSFTSTVLDTYDGQLKEIPTISKKNRLKFSTSLRCFSMSEVMFQSPITTLHSKHSVFVWFFSIP